MHTVLVTGINGFVGKHLTRELVSRDIKVIGVGHRENTADAEIADLLNCYYQCDVTDSASTSKLPLSLVDCIINLAGLANVGASFDNPDLYMKINVKVLSVLGDELLTANPSARMIAVSTGALYDPNQSMPLSEQSRVIKDGSPYALSKLAMEQAAKELRDRGLDCIVVRPFNHIGPGQGTGFLLPDLTRQLLETNRENPSVSAGNLKTIRDYTDVRDIARAYADLAIIDSLENHLYNVCSGRGHSGNDMVKDLCEELEIDSNKLVINVNDKLIRPTDPPRIVGDNSLLSTDTGWLPKISLDKTIKDIITSKK